MRSALWPQLGALTVALVLAPLSAHAAAVATPPAAQDAGSRASSDEDREIEENLELLEHLDETADLDLLLELSQEAAANGSREAAPYPPSRQPPKH